MFVRVSGVCVGVDVCERVTCVRARVHARVVPYLSDEMPRAFIDPALVHRSIIVCILSQGGYRYER